jgi:endonuclease/exonuclease/phosphatase family metal-dependent hydrolase
MRLKILSYNIHKGFNVSNSKLVIDQIRDTIKSVEADIVFLQEVVGENEQHLQKHKNWPDQSQFEFLADNVWTHYSYGKNAIYEGGHHGNAILSKFPFQKTENINISTNRFESRGLLHGQILIPDMDREIDLFCLHLNLFETGRSKQIDSICEYVEKLERKNSPLVIAGDFNDWRGLITRKILERLGAKEAFMEFTGAHAKTFPSWLPGLALDRVYFAHLNLIEAKKPRGPIWKKLSDHIPLLVELEIN